ncbi:hypothetical protein AAC03nite_20050 [Alicyclobacillus acidoterrestris]|nr:hypothetical protein AAC03nite_20050 [Alicyclobacillus acidoterrestris]
MDDEYALPSWLDDQLDSDAILQDMLQDVPDDLDKSKAGFVWDALAPASIKFALAASWAQQMLQRGFAQTTFGTYLDYRGGEHGISRFLAQPATGQVTFTGTPGTLIPSGTRVSTVSTDTTQAVFFDTQADATIGSDGTVTVAVTAEDAGTGGNVPANSITLLGDTIDGISSLTNSAATTGGLDDEDDDSYLARYLTKVQNPSSGGNKADYINWAMEVAGVGGVSVIPVRDGPGTVSIAIINTDKVPASQDLVDAVQNYIAPPWVDTLQAPSMTIGGNGVSIDTTQTDASQGQSVKMVYDAGGHGTLTQDIQATLQQPGIWQARVSVKVDATTDSTDDLLQIGVFNVTANSWCGVSPSDNTACDVTYKASDLSTAFAQYIVTFYWNGEDDVQFQATRLTSDATTTVWVDTVTLQSTFSTDQGDGKAPIGARVTVEPAGLVSINVSAQLILVDGYDRSSVESAVSVSITNYLRTLAFSDMNEVLYNRIGDAILNTLGVEDHQGLTVNGSTANIPVGAQQVAVLGQVSWS